MSAPPDLLVARDGGSAAVRGPDGRLVILGHRPDDYTAAQWLLRDGDQRTIAAARKGANCDEQGCVAVAKDGRLVALSLRAGGLLEDCGRAHVLIAAVPMRRSCPGPEVVLDRFDIARDGATALKLRAGGISMETVAAVRGKRPWTTKVSD